MFRRPVEEQTAEALGIPVRTVRRDPVKARGWLYDQLQPDARHLAAARL